MRQLLPLAFLCLMAPAAACCVNPSLVRFADEIVKRQAYDGAIVQGNLTAQNNNVVPYFANVAALGLVTAYRITSDVRYMSTAKRWADWYSAHMNADGTVNDYTGAPGAWKSTGNYDSTDSYAATYLELLVTISPANKGWTVARYPSVGKAVAAIQLTMQPVGLTLAKPTWPVMYVMDNVETARGLRSAARLATLAAHPADATAWNAMAAKMEAAIESSLWDAARNEYYVGIQPDGGIMRGNGEWYPCVMANLMAVAWGKPSERHVALYKHLSASYAATIPASATTEDDVDHLVWWGLAAGGAGDRARTKAISDRITLLDMKKVPLNNTALLGQCIRVVSR